ncbi:MAG: NAD(P)/FAD-dependent oxidoreductase [Chlorobi bacterium]|nr:NAD(P)/FAD-dependent oxidoreductase [Chlorobiota bacterium]
MNKKIVIIGNGISGITAARHIRKLSNYNITVISDETKYFYSRTALMYIYMGQMKFEHTQPYENWFWQKNRINLIHDRVIKILHNENRIIISNEKSIEYDYLIIATGSKPNKFGWPGQNLKAVQGLYHISDLETMEKYSASTKHAVIVGGGLIGVEMAEMFLSRKIKVTFLVREKSFWNSVLPKEESALINRLILSHHINLRLETELKEIIGNDEGRVTSVRTGKNEIIECQFVGLTAGVSPNVKFLMNSGIEIDRGVLVDEYLQTNISNIFAVGDCTQQRVPLENRRPFEQVWYTGRIMGRTVAYTICKEKTTYKPGIWFNSAKFFDLEFQTYGWVFNKLRDGEESFYWEHPTKFMALRLIYNSNKNNILGFNCFGIRFRHKVCEKWIQDKRSIDYVMENLAVANFDPEFYKKYEKEIIEKYNSKKDKHIELKSKRKLLSWFSY